MFLFSSEKLEKHKHFEPVVSHLGAVFTRTLEPLLFIHMKTIYKYFYTSFSLLQIYLSLYYLSIMTFDISIYIVVYYYFGLCSTLTSFRPFIRHPLSKFTLRPCIKFKDTPCQKNLKLCLRIRWCLLIQSVPFLSKICGRLPVKIRTDYLPQILLY